MASLFDGDLSSDSEDDDYVPDGEVTSDDDEEPIPLENNEIHSKEKSKNNKVLGAVGEKSKLLEDSSSTETKVDEKQRADDLFKSFLAEVETEMKTKNESPHTPNIKTPEAGSSYKSPAASSDSGVKSGSEECVIDEVAPKKQSFKIFDFAGEEVVVPIEDGNNITSVESSSSSDLEKNKNLDKNESEKPANQSAAQRKGLTSVLGTIMNKKTKMTTLQKTSLDWMQYKKDMGISEELESYNKGKSGYIERKRFLERSDWRSYEIERDLRMSKRKKS